MAIAAANNKDTETESAINDNDHMTYDTELVLPTVKEKKNEYFVS